MNLKGVPDSGRTHPQIPCSKMSSPTSFRLPHFSTPFPERRHPKCEATTVASDQWLLSKHTDGATGAQRRRLSELNAATFMACSYHYTDDEKVRVLCDGANALWVLDDISESLPLESVPLFRKTIMNALHFPDAYRRELPDGTVLPEPEPYSSRICREYVLFGDIIYPIKNAFLQVFGVGLSSRRSLGSKSVFLTEWKNGSRAWLEKHNLARTVSSLGWRNSFPSAGRQVQLHLVFI